MTIPILVPDTSSESSLSDVGTFVTPRAYEPEEDLVLRLEPQEDSFEGNLRAYLEPENPIVTSGEMGFFRVVRGKDGLPVAMTRLSLSAEGKALLDQSLQKLHQTELANRNIAEARLLGFNLSKLRLEIEIDGEREELELFGDDPHVKEMLDLAQMHLKDLVLTSSYKRGIKGNLKSSFALEWRPLEVEQKKLMLADKITPRDQLLQELAELRNPEEEEGVYPEAQYDLLGRIEDLQKAVLDALNAFIANQEQPDPAALILLQKLNNLDHFALTFAVSQEPYELEDLDLEKEKQLLQEILHEPVKSGIFESVKSRLFSASKSKTLNEEEVTFLKEILAMRAKNRFQLEDKLQISTQESLEEVIFRLAKGESLEDLTPALENILRNIPGMKEESLQDLVSFFHPVKSLTRNIFYPSDLSSLTESAEEASLLSFPSTASSYVSNSRADLVSFPREEVKVKADGNCFYLSALELIKNGEIRDDLTSLGNTARVQELRDKIADWIKQNQDDPMVQGLVEETRQAHLEEFAKKIQEQVSDPNDEVASESSLANLLEESRKIANQEIHTLLEEKEAFEAMDYADFVRGSGNYAGEVEIYALSKLYDKSVRIFGQKTDGSEEYVDLSGHYSKEEGLPKQRCNFWRNSFCN